jgi:hypothetical protein
VLPLCFLRPCFIFCAPALLLGMALLEGCYTLFLLLCFEGEAMLSSALFLA